MLQIRPVPSSASASFFSGGSCQCHSQPPQRSSRVGGAARSAPGLAAFYLNTIENAALLHQFGRVRGLPRVKSPRCGKVLPCQAVNIFLNY